MSCSKDCKKFGLAAVAAFLAYNIMEYLFHGVILLGVYQRPRYLTVWNPPPDMARRRIFGILAYLIFIPIFTKIYVQGYEEGKSGLGQGLRYGLLMGLMVPTMHALINYMVYPISLHLALTWIAGGIIEMTLLGAIIGSIYRPAHDH